MLNKDLMQKLSPSDPLLDKNVIRYRLILNVVLKDNIVVSKVLALLKKYGIKKIESYLNNLRITFTTNNEVKVNELIDKIRMLNNMYEILCYQVYITLPYSKDLVNAITNYVIKHSSLDGIKIYIINFNNILFWIYMNICKNKVVVKVIKKEITLPEPELISESMFIKCKDNIDSILNDIKEDIRKYNMLLTNIGM